MSLFSNWTVGRRLLAGFGLSAAVLMLVAVVSYRNAYLLIENDAWVAHSHQVRIELADLLSELKDAETGQRGFLLTGHEDYLVPYTTAKAALAGEFTIAHGLIDGTPQQKRWLDALERNGYDRRVALEYEPSTDAAHAFDWLTA